jgi:methyl-accepting chemotaxis protein
VKKLKISTRLYLLVGFALLAMASSTLFVLLETQRALESNRRNLLTVLSDTATGILDGYYKQEQAGAMTRQEAQARAIVAIRAMRYEPSGYFWINDMNKNMIMHAAKPEMEGTDQSATVDPAGKHIFIEMVSLVQKQKQGFVDYQWPKPGSDAPVLKYSYVKGFEPWGWVVGTGVYADDVTAAVIDYAIKLLSLGSIVGALILIAAYAVVRSVVQPIDRIKASMQAISQEQLSEAVPETDRGDEIGNMARVLVVLRASVEERINMRVRESQQQQALDAERMSNENHQREFTKAQTDAMDSLGLGLEKLAQGDLTAHIDAIHPQYAKLKDDFNNAVDALGSVIRAIMVSSDVVNGNADDISDATHNLSLRTEQQAASLEQTAAALDEITSTVRNSSERAVEARSVVNKTKNSAEKSGEIVRNAIEAMSRIEQSSSKISQIIGVIDEIAFQTNLLALNAGVEAARAGDAGKGFAVVAQEVRELAQRSASAAKEIKTLITASSDEVQTGVNLVRSSGDVLHEIEMLVNHVNDHVVAIAQSAEEQSAGLLQVNSAVNSMDQVTQQNAAMVEETTAASQALAQESANLKHHLGRFRVAPSGDSVRGKHRHAA